ncbi:hypothetical protein MKX01_011076 [Papaver californicum]|nr:hypothetical protein MKX01_011076 [Papaver californicum]
MENAVGFMTVFAVSGSVVLFALQAHKRLLSDFMKKKKVHFADDVIEPSSNNKEYRRQQRTRLNIDRSSSSSSCNSQCQMINPDEEELESKMPQNRRALYQGILQSKILKGNTVSDFV